MEAKKILVVEDEFIVALDVASSLESMGHTVVGVVDNGEEAIVAVAREHPDLLVLDVNINGDMSGVEAFRLIREMGSIPVIFLTGYREPGILQERLGTKMKYMSKPFDPEELRDVVECMIRRDRGSGAC